MIGGLISKVFLALAFAFAAMVVAWHFYIHDHRALNEDSIARSIDGDASCREEGREWRCRAGGKAFVVERTRKNCWKARDAQRDDCVKFFDYVLSLP